MEQVGFFGSYARGNWGVGSDVDLLLIVQHCSEPFIRRAADWDTTTTTLPVPADILIYSRDEWERLKDPSPFFQTMSREVVWVYPPANPSVD